MKHVAGNLASRWTDFLTTDGEKPWRNRDEEFVDNFGSRAEILEAAGHSYRLAGDAKAYEQEPVEHAMFFSQANDIPFDVFGFEIDGDQHLMLLVLGNQLEHLIHGWHLLAGELLIKPTSGI
ncbi:MAG: DUF1572 family protein [Pirellulales bacterium]